MLWARLFGSQRVTLFVETCSLGVIVVSAENTVLYRKPYLWFVKTNDGYPPILQFSSGGELTIPDSATIITGTATDCSGMEKEAC